MPRRKRATVTEADAFRAIPPHQGAGGGEARGGEGRGAKGVWAAVFNLTKN